MINAWAMAGRGHAHKLIEALSGASRLRRSGAVHCPILTTRKSVQGRKSSNVQTSAYKRPLCFLLQFCRVLLQLEHAKDTLLISIYTNQLLFWFDGQSKVFERKMLSIS